MSASTASRAVRLPWMSDKQCNAQTAPATHDRMTAAPIAFGPAWAAKAGPASAIMISSSCRPRSTAIRLASSEAASQPRVYAAATASTGNRERSSSSNLCSALCVERVTPTSRNSPSLISRIGFTCKVRATRSIRGMIRSSRPPRRTHSRVSRTKMIEVRARRFSAVRWTKSALRPASACRRLPTPGAPCPARRSPCPPRARDHRTPRPPAMPLEGSAVLAGQGQADHIMPGIDQLLESVQKSAGRRR